MVGITNIAYCFLIWVKKAKYLKYSWKIGPYLSEKPALCWWRHQNKRSLIYFKSKYLNLKRVKYVSHVSIGLNKRWRSSSYFQIDCFCNFCYSTEQRWRHSDVLIHLIRAFCCKMFILTKVILYKIWVV